MQYNYYGMNINFPEGTTEEEAQEWVASNKMVADAELAKFNNKNDVVVDKADTLLGDITNATGNVQSDIPSGYLGEEKSKEQLDKEKADRKKVLNKLPEGANVLATAAANTYNTIAGNTPARYAGGFQYTLDDKGELIENKEAKESPLLVNKDTLNDIKPKTEVGGVLSEVAPFFLPGGAKSGRSLSTHSGNRFVGPNKPTTTTPTASGNTSKITNVLTRNAAQSTTGVAVNNDTSTQEGRVNAVKELATGTVLGGLTDKVIGKVAGTVSPVVKGVTEKANVVKDKIKASTTAEKELIQEGYEAGKLARKYGKDVKDDLIDTVNKNSHNFPDGDGALSRILTEDGKSTLNPSQVFTGNNKFVKSEKRAIANKNGDTYLKRFDDQASGKTVRNVSEDSSLMHPFITKPDGSKYVARPLDEILEDISKLPTPKVKGVKSPNEVLTREINAGRYTSPTAIRASSAIAKENPSKAYLADELATRGSIELRNKALNEATKGNKLDSIKYEKEISKNKDSLTRLSGIESGNKPYATQKQVGQDIEDSLRLMDGSRAVAEDSKIRDILYSALPAIGLTSAFSPNPTGFGPVDALIGYGAYAGKRRLNKIRDRSNAKKSDVLLNKILSDKDVGRNGDVRFQSDLIKDVKAGNVNNTYSPNLQGFNELVDKVGNNMARTAAGASRSFGTVDYPQPSQEPIQLDDSVDVNMQSLDTPIQLDSDINLDEPIQLDDSVDIDVSEIVTKATNVSEEASVVAEAIVKAETGGMKDPFVFTGGKDPNATDHSSAYGPGQITRNLAKDYLDRKADLFTPEQIEYLELMVEQGSIMLNNARNGVKGTDLSYGGKGVLGETAKDRQLYKEVMGVMIEDKLRENNGNLSKTLQSWRGVDSGKDPRWYNVVYSELDKNL